jgi:hypothetical protein
VADVTLVFRPEGDPEQNDADNLADEAPVEK